MSTSCPALQYPCSFFWLSCVLRGLGLGMILGRQPSGLEKASWLGHVQRLRDLLDEECLEMRRRWARHTGCPGCRTRQRMGWRWLAIGVAQAMLCFYRFCALMFIGGRSSVTAEATAIRLQNIFLVAQGNPKIEPLQNVLAKYVYVRQSFSFSYGHLQKTQAI